MIGKCLAASLIAGLLLTACEKTPAGEKIQSGAEPSAAAPTSAGSPSGPPADVTGEPTIGTVASAEGAATNDPAAAPPLAVPAK